MAVIYIYILLYLTSKASTLFRKFPYTIPHMIRCYMMARLLLLITFSSILKRAFSVFAVMDYTTTLKLVLSNYPDFGCGFFVFGCFTRIFTVLALLCMLIFGFKLVRFGGHHCILSSLKSSANFSVREANDGDNDDGKVVGVRKIESFECGTTKMECRGCGAHKFEEKYEDQDEFCNEDEMFDVMSLRKMVKRLRRKANAANSELEKERMAASSAVDEAMAMILRLQNEKSVLQMRVSQLERMSEEKQGHDQEVIQSLQWIVMRHESERSLLEENLRVCRDKLRVFIKGEEWDQFDRVCPTPSNDHYYSYGMSKGEDGFVRSLDFDSSPF